MSTITIYTDGGMRRNCAGWGFWAMDGESKEFHGYGAAGQGVSNNVAELVAAINALTFAIHQGYQSIHMFMDSEYVIGGMNKINNGIWPVTNVDLWVEFEAIRKLVHDKQITVTFDWVKGHSDVHGNEMADQLATRGLIAQMNGLNTKSIEEIKKEIPKEERVEIEPFNAMITGREWYFRTNIASTMEDGRYFYCSTTFTRDKDDPTFYAGKNEPDSHYSLLLSKVPITPLENLRKVFSNKVGDEVAHTLVQLPAVKKDDAWKALTVNALDYTAMDGLMAITSTNEPLGMVVKPPRLVFKMLDYFNQGLGLIQRYEQEREDLAVFDVTDFFVTVNTKGKREIRKDFTQNEKSIIFKHIQLKDGRVVDVTMNVGIDMPNRNQVSNIIKMDPMKEIRFSLLIWGVTEKSYHCAMIIEREEMIGAYYTSDSSFRIIK